MNVENLFKNYTSGLPTRWCIFVPTDICSITICMGTSIYATATKWLNLKTVSETHGKASAWTTATQWLNFIFRYSDSTTSRLQLLTFLFPWVNTHGYSDYGLSDLFRLPLIYVTHTKRHRAILNDQIAMKYKEILIVKKTEK